LRFSIPVDNSVVIASLALNVIAILSPGDASEDPDVAFADRAFGIR